MTTTDTVSTPQMPPLTHWERRLLAATGIGAVAVGGLGLASSVEAVSAAAERWGFGSPWMLPAGIDVAIPVFTLANLLLIRADMPLAWVRSVPWFLTTVTCWLNVASGHSLSAKIAHGTMPLLWVVLSEVAAHVYSSRLGVVTGRRMEKIRRSRWLLAFPSTFGLWRRMTLWEITSYGEALARERERQLTRAELRERYGRAWRRKAPRRTRVLLRLGELAPAGETETPAPPKPEPEPEPELKPEPGSKPEPESDPEKAEPPKLSAQPQSVKRPAHRAARSARMPARTRAELLAEAREVTADWPDDAVNAVAIRTALRCSAANSRVLRDALLSERADSRALHHAPEAA